MNALAAIGVSLSVEAPVKAIQKALTEFTGVGRRFSIWGEARNKDGKKYLVVDDYGHHPAEMSATIKAARGAYPDKEIILAFQPHRYSRTRDCFEDLVRVLSTVDKLILCEVYPAGEEPIVGADSRSLCRALRVAGKVEPIFAANLDEVEEQIEMHVSDDSVLLVMGAGSIGSIPAKLIAKGKNYEK